MKARVKKKQGKPIETIVATVVASLDRAFERMARNILIIKEYERVMEHLLLILTCNEGRKLLEVDDDLCPLGSFVIQKVEQLLAERRKVDGDSEARE